MNCACLFYLDERECGSEVDASPGKSLSGAVSVVKAGQVQDGATTSCVQRQRSVFMAMNGPFWPVDLLPFLSFEEILLPRLKSSTLVVFAAGALYYNLLHMEKISAQSFFTKNIMEYIPRVQTVWYQATPRGGGAWGRE